MQLRFFLPLLFYTCHYIIVQIEDMEKIEIDWLVFIEIYSAHINQVCMFILLRLKDVVRLSFLTQAYLHRDL